MTRMRAIVLIGLFSAGAAAQGRIDMKVRSAGFQAPLDVERFVGRDGQWLPIHLEITFNGPQPIQGEIRAEAPDLDGDLVSYVESPVALTPGGGIKHVWCYVTTAFPIRHEVRISFIADGVKLAGTTLPPIGYLPNRKHLMLDVSDAALTRLRSISLHSETISDVSVGADRKLTVEYVVAAMECSELPDRWFGLESVDTIVWDEPDPSKLSDAQIDALKTWVRNGGKLVIGVGTNWQKVQRSALLELLPFKGDETTVTIRKLPPLLRDALAGKDSKRTEFARDVQVVAVTDKTRGIRMLGENVPGVSGYVNFLSLRHYGSGRVIAAATSLRELFEIAATPDRLATRIFDAFTANDAFLKSEAKSAYNMTLSPMSGMPVVYDALVGPTQFKGVTSALWFGALVFVLVYAGVAISSYVYLTKKSLAHLSWSVFAAFAVVGSAVSLAMVGASRGFHRGVSSTAIIDLDAGTSTARGPMWFGYSSALRQFVDLALPGDGNYLRPLAPPRADTQAYATPLRYEAVTGKALLHNTPLRATLKQFEGYWNGTLNGTIRSELQASRKTGYLANTSWVKNDLAVPLEGGVLLYLDPRAAKVPLPARAADYEVEDRPRRGNALPADAVIIVPIPNLSPGGEARGWMREEYAKLDADILRAVADKVAPDQMPNLTTLAKAQLDWVARNSGITVGRSGDPSATMLLSTRALFLPAELGKPDEYSSGRLVNFENIVSRDVSHWLTSGSAVLLLFSPTPAPASLQRNGEAMPARDGFTLYRVRVPLSYVDERNLPQPESAPASQDDAGDAAAPPPGTSGENP